MGESTAAELERRDRAVAEEERRRELGIFSRVMVEAIEGENEVVDGSRGGEAEPAVEGCDGGAVVGGGIDAEAEEGGAGEEEEAAVDDGCGVRGVEVEERD